ncbi:hypothetical protein JCM11251_005239 [Rhodosporidiobolus azoricus]
MPSKAAGQHNKEELANALTDEIVRELVTDIAIEEHRLAQLRRSRAAGAPAGTAPALTNGLLAPPDGANGATVSPSKKEKDEGLFDCLVCGRSIAAPRYASHLAGCMGLTGSRRGAGRTATANGKVNGSSRPGSVANSDSDSGKANGIKRAATSSPVPNGGPKPKKPKPAPVSTLPPQFQQPNVGSHPLSKTMSLPTSPLTPTSTTGTASATPSPSVVSGRIVPPPPPPLSASSNPTSTSMQSRKTLPGSTPLPSNPALAAQKRPPHPLAQSPARPPLSAAQLASDRPDSDSESDSDLDARPSGAHSKASAQKIPRRGGGGGQTQTTAPQKRPPGSAAGSVGGATQTAPKKAVPVGRSKVKGVVELSDSEDDASGGSDSD